MWRGIVSIIALILIVGALLVIIPIMVIPNTFLHQLVPVLRPLHEAIACESGETMAYEQVNDPEGNYTRFYCVNAAGQERNVDDIVMRPAYYGLGVLCLGGLLMLAPLFVAVRQGLNGETSPELQNALNQSYQQLRQMPSAMSQTSPTSLSASGATQLESLEKLRAQGLINQDAYESAKQKIFDEFGED